MRCNISECVYRNKSNSQCGYNGEIYIDYPLYTMNPCCVKFREEGQPSIEEQIFPGYVDSSPCDDCKSVKNEENTLPIEKEKENDMNVYVVYGCDDCHVAEFFPVAVYKNRREAELFMMKHAIIAMVNISVKECNMGCRFDLDGNLDCVYDSQDSCVKYFIKELPLQ